MKRLDIIKKIVTLGISLAMIFTLAGCGNRSNSNSPGDGAGSGSGETDDIDEIANMPLEDKIAQMIIASTRFVDDSEDAVGVTEMTPEIEELLKKHHLGGVILFAQNIVDGKQTAKLIQDMQKANADGGSQTGLFVAVDQEGGRITRLNTGTQMPGNMALGATYNPPDDNYELVEEAGTVMGQELAAIGFNVDFAPVMDVNSNPNNPIIGIRSFSDDPKIVGKLGKAMIEGLHSANIITSIKHFPGHGDTDVDSHTGLPLIGKTYDELMEWDLLPFIENISNTDMIMSAHIQFPDIGTETYVSKETGEEIFVPATLSESILKDILRDKLGYEGIIITDALDMGAIATHFDKMDAAKLAINAGVDILLMPVTDNVAGIVQEMDEYIEGIVNMVESGEIPEENINKSVERILALKEKYGIMPGKLPEIDLDSVESKIGNAENHDKEWEIACKAVTILKGASDIGVDAQVLPISRDSKVVVAVPYNSQINSITYGVNKFNEFAKSFYGEAEDFSSNVSVICYEDVKKWDFDDLLKDADVVVGVSALYSAAELNPDSEDGENSKFMDELLNKTHEMGKKFVLISAQLPYDTARFTDADSILACYNARGLEQLPEGTDDFDGPFPSYGPNLPAAMFVALGGGGFGQLPVDIPMLNDDYSYSEEILFERGYGQGYDM